MGKWGWFSSDDDGKVVAKTEVHDNGTVHRYEYTKEDDIKQGHGHTVYENMDKYLKDEPSASRSKDADESKNRPWKGPGYCLDLRNMDFGMLQYLDSLTQNSYVKRSIECEYKRTLKR